MAFAAMALGAAVLPSAAEGDETVPGSLDAKVAQVLARAADLEDRLRPSGAEAAGSVPSPATVIDAVPDSFPYHPRGELTVFQVRNGRDFVELRFWLVRRPDTWNSAATGAILPIDMAANGRGNDFDVVVVSTRETGKIAVIGPPNFTPEQVRCVSPNVSDLGPSQLGYGYSVRFKHSCIGGRRAFRSRAIFFYAWFPGDDLPTVDVVPSRTWTPNVRPA